MVATVYYGLFLCPRAPFIIVLVRKKNKTKWLETCISNPGGERKRGNQSLRRISGSGVVRKENEKKTRVRDVSRALVEMEKKEETRARDAYRALVVVILVMMLLVVMLVVVAG